MKRLLVIKACHQCTNYQPPAVQLPPRCHLTGENIRERHSIPGSCPLPIAAETTE